MPKPHHTRSNFLHELIEQATDSRKVAAHYQYFTDPTSMEKPGDLRTILCIEDDHLSQVARESLKILEEEEEFRTPWKDLKWKVSAYITIQDTFSGPIFKSRNDLSQFRQWYFYYEAKYILVEAILCGLNGFSASLGLLMRLFLEFSLLQNYFFLKIQEMGSYSIIEDYFEKSHNPNWSTILNGCLPAKNFCKPIRKRLKIHLDGLSETSAHPYHPHCSPKHLGSFVPEQSLEGLFFSYKISMILEPVLWMYFVNFPMLFHPVDVQKKFGFNYPVGLFIDETGAELIRRSLTKEDYNHFYEFSKKTTQYDGLMNFYNSRPDMSQKQIEATWDSENDGEFKDLFVGHCMQMSKLRALTETMALEPREEPPSSIDRFADNFAFDKWRNFYKKIK